MGKGEGVEVQELEAEVVEALVERHVPEDRYQGSRKMASLRSAISDFL